MSHCFACRARVDQSSTFSYYRDAFFEAMNSCSETDEPSFDEILHEKSLTLEQIARQDYGVVLPPDRNKPSRRRKAAKGKKKR